MVEKSSGFYVTISNVGVFKLVQALQINWELDVLALDS